MHPSIPAFITFILFFLNISARSIQPNAFSLTLNTSGRYSNTSLLASKLSTVASELSVVASDLSLLASESPLIASNPPPLASGTTFPLHRRYASGNCNVQIGQYQKGKGPNGPVTNTTADYRLEIVLQDANGNNVGSNFFDAPTDTWVGTESELPYIFNSECRATDEDPINFQYLGQAWSTADEQCTLGAFTTDIDAHRSGNCEFYC